MDRGWGRAVILPVLGRLLHALSMAYNKASDVTAIVLAVVAYYAAAALVLLVAGLRVGRTPRTR